MGKSAEYSTKIDANPAWEKAWNEVHFPALVRMREIEATVESLYPELAEASIAATSKRQQQHMAIKECSVGRSLVGGGMVLERFMQATPEEVLDLKLEWRSHFDLLVREYDKLISSIVNRYTTLGLPTCLDEDDLKAVATMALRRAILRYQPQTQTRLSTLATVCIKNSIVNLLKEMSRDRHLSLDAIVEDRRSKAGNGRSLYSMLPHGASVEGAVESNMIAELISQAFGAIYLSERNRTIIMMRLIEGRTQKDIAEVFGMRYQNVGQIERQTINKLCRRPEFRQAAIIMGLITGDENIEESLVWKTFHVYNKSRPSSI